MMTLPVPVTTGPVRTPVSSPTVAGNDGRFADALATHLAERGASTQPRTDGARDRAAATGDDRPRPAPTDDRRVRGRTDDADRRTDRGHGSERTDRAHQGGAQADERIGDRDRAEGRSSSEDTTAADDVRDARRTEAGGGDEVENQPADDGTAETDDVASGPSDATDDATEAVAATAVPAVIHADARVAVPALGTRIADAIPANGSTPTDQAAATVVDEATVRTGTAGLGAHASGAAPAGATPAPVAAAAAATATTAATTAAAAVSTDGDGLVPTAPVAVAADGDGTPGAAPSPSSPVAGSTPTLPSALAAALDATTDDAVDQNGLPSPVTTTKGTDAQAQPSPTTPTPASQAPSLGAAADPAVAVTSVPTPAAGGGTSAAGATAVSSTTVDSAVATATSATQALSTPGVARSELTAPQRLAAVIAPEAGRMRGTVGHRTLEIRLDPPDLGTVDLEIRSSGSTVTIVARTESADAMLAVLRQRDQIEASLRDLGMDLSSFDVSAGTPEREQAENRRDTVRGRAATGSAAEPAEVDATTPTPINTEGSVFL